MNISLRTKKILDILADNYEFMTVSSIAEKVDVSSRTILRELDDIESWLNSHGFELEKKKGTGIRIKGNDQDFISIKKLLKMESIEKYYTPQERRLIIISELLKEQDPKKLFCFTKLTNVSETTISHDLNKIEKWLNKYKLKLIRKPGLGVYVEGNEVDIRRASINLLYENIDKKQIFNLIQTNLTVPRGFDDNRALNADNRLLSLIGFDMINMLERFIKEVEKNIGFKLADDSFVALVVHLAIAIKRIKNNEKITIAPELFNNLKNTKEYEIASGLIVVISNAFNIDIPEAEIGYVTMHLRGSKGRGVFYTSDVSMTDDYKLFKIAREIIQIAEIESGIYLKQNEKLLIGLVRHLKPAINRLKLGLEIRNPLLHEIKEQYPELYEIAEKCGRVINEDESIRVPESEIAYIAMHLGAVLKGKIIKPEENYRAAVACTSGIGASRLLASRLKKEFDNIEITETISTIDFDNDLLKEKGVDFIISTVPISESSVPVITVNPLLTDKHQKKIKKFINNFKKTGSLSPRPRLKSKFNLREKLGIIDDYNQRIMEVLDNFRIIENVHFKDIYLMIREISQMLISEKEKYKILESDLIEREKKGSTIIEENQLMLLHCRTKAVEELMFILLKPEELIRVLNFKNQAIKVKTVVILLAPFISEKPALEVMSEISRMLIEDERFLKTIDKGNEDEVFQELNYFLDEFYQQKSRMKYLKEDF